MKLRFRLLAVTGLGLILALYSWSHSKSDSTVRQDQQSKPGAAREVGSGAGKVGTGAAKGAGNIGKGTAKAAADLVTLHPGEAGASVGKGAGHAGKDVTVGSVKGTGKIAKGIGRAFKHLF